MPPKAPTLKFKPKLVVQRKEENESASGVDASSSTLGAAPSLTDSTSLQQDRLRRLEALQADGYRDPAAGMSDYSRIRASDAATATASSKAAPTNTTTTSRRTGTHGNSGGGGSSGGGGGGGASSTLGSPGVARSSHLSAQARLNRAIMQHVDRSQFPPTAPPLPLNTMESYFAADGPRAGESAVAYARQHRPIPLHAGPASHSSGGAAPSEATVVTDGTAFLREAEAETQQVYTANRRFHEVLRARVTDEPNSAPQPTSGTPSLVWAQMPRFSSDAPFDLAHTQACGKVGELKVYKSGRMVMTIGSVSYDVAVDDEGHDGCASTSTMAAITQPPAYPSDPSSLASCYLLGQLTNKMICTPSLGQL